MGPPAAGWVNLILLGEVNAELKMGENFPELTAAKEGGGGNNVEVTGKLEAGTGAVGIKGIGMIPDEVTATKEGGGGNNVEVTGKLEAGTGAVGIKDIGMIPVEEVVATLAGSCCCGDGGKP